MNLKLLLIGAGAVLVYFATRNTSQKQPVNGTGNPLYTPQLYQSDPNANPLYTDALYQSVTAAQTGPLINRPGSTIDPQVSQAGASATGNTTISGLDTVNV